MVAWGLCAPYTERLVCDRWRRRAAGTLMLAESPFDLALLADLAWVQDVVGVEHALDAGHQLDGGVAQVLAQIGALGVADAVLADPIALLLNPDAIALWPSPVEFLSPAPAASL